MGVWWTWARRLRCSLVSWWVGTARSIGCARRGEPAGRCASFVDRPASARAGWSASSARGRSRREGPCWSVGRPPAAAPLRPIREALLGAARLGIRPGDDLAPFVPTLSALVPEWGEPHRRHGGVRAGARGGRAPPAGGARGRAHGHVGGRGPAVGRPGDAWPSSSTSPTTWPVSPSCSSSRCATARPATDESWRTPGGPSGGVRGGPRPLAAGRRRRRWLDRASPDARSRPRPSRRWCRAARASRSSSRSCCSPRSTPDGTTLADAVPGSVLTSVELRLEALPAPGRRLLDGRRAARADRSTGRWRPGWPSSTKHAAAEQFRRGVRAQLLDVDGSSFRFRHAPDPRCRARRHRRRPRWSCSPAAPWTSWTCRRRAPWIVIAACSAAELAGRAGRRDLAAAFLLRAARLVLGQGALASAEAFATRARRARHRRAGRRGRRRPARDQRARRPHGTGWHARRRVAGATPRARRSGRGAPARGDRRPGRRRWDRAEQHAEAAATLAPDVSPAGAGQRARRARRDGPGRGRGRRGSGQGGVAAARARASLVEVQCEALEVLGRAERGRDPAVRRGGLPGGARHRRGRRARPCGGCEHCRSSAPSTCSSRSTSTAWRKRAARRSPSAHWRRWRWSTSSCRPCTKGAASSTCRSPRPSLRGRLTPAAPVDAADEPRPPGAWCTRAGPNGRSWSASSLPPWPPARTPTTSTLMVWGNAIPMFHLVTGDLARRGGRARPRDGGAPAASGRGRAVPGHVGTGPHPARRGWRGRPRAEVAPTCRSTRR